MAAKGRTGGIPPGHPNGKSIPIDRLLGTSPVPGGGRRPPIPLPVFRSEMIAEYAKMPFGPEALRAVSRALDVLGQTPGMATTADLAAPDLEERFLKAGGWTKPATGPYYAKRLRIIRRFAIAMGYIKECENMNIVTI